MIGAQQYAEWSHQLIRWKDRDRLSASMMCVHVMYTCVTQVDWDAKPFFWPLSHINVYTTALHVCPGHINNKKETTISTTSLGRGRKIINRSLTRKSTRVIYIVVFSLKHYWWCVTYLRFAYLRTSERNMLADQMWLDCCISSVCFFTAAWEDSASIMIKV